MASPNRYQGGRRREENVPGVASWSEQAASIQYHADVSEVGGKWEGPGFRWLDRFGERFTTEATVRFIVRNVERFRELLPIQEMEQAMAAKDAENARLRAKLIAAGIDVDD